MRSYKIKKERSNRLGFADCGKVCEENVRNVGRNRRIRGFKRSCWKDNVYAQLVLVDDV